MKGEEEYHKVTVTYTYKIPDNNWDLWLVQNAKKMYEALEDISAVCRTASKHGDDDKVSEFAEKVRDLVFQVPFDDDTYLN